MIDFAQSIKSLVTAHFCQQNVCSTFMFYNIFFTIFAIFTVYCFEIIFNPTSPLLQQMTFENIVEKEEIDHHNV